MNRKIDELQKAYTESCRMFNKARDDKYAYEKELTTLLRAEYDLQLKQLAKSVDFVPAATGYRYKIDDEGIHYLNIWTD